MESNDSKTIIPTTKDGKIKEAMRLKEEGNRFFKEKNYAEALKNYAKVSLYINGLTHKSDELHKYAKDNDMIIDDYEKELIDNLKYTTLLNMTQIDLYNKNYEKASKRATESLKIKPTAKGYFRRGCAKIELGDLEEAEDDFKKVLELEPDNQDVKEKLKVIKQKQKIVDKGMMQKLKNMFV